MKRYMSLAVAVAVMVPFVASDADAATKTKAKTNGPQVAGFVQTAPGLGGTITNVNPLNERIYLSQRDNTQKFFGRIADRSPG
jgi:hypothetical protein